MSPSKQPSPAPVATQMSPLRRRNRQALLDAAGQMMDEGVVPTVAEAADRAEISRATAYRYFSSPEQLQNEAALDVIARGISNMVVEEDPARPLEDTVAALIGGVHAMSIQHEIAFRTMLRLSLEPAGGSRGGRRMGWIANVLERAALPAETKSRVVPALSILCGIEAHIVLDDVCGLSPEEAGEVLKWAARALTRAAMDEAAAG